MLKCFPVELNCLHACLSVICPSSYLTATVGFIRGMLLHLMVQLLVISKINGNGALILADIKPTVVFFLQRFHFANILT